jgi:hypothetical protein
MNDANTPQHDDFNAKLDAMLDRELTDADRAAFLAASSPHADKRRDILETTRAVSMLRDPVAAPDLSASIMARVEHTRPLLSTRVAQWVRPSRVAMVAAGVAVALTLIGFRGAIVRAESDAPVASLAVATADDLRTASESVASGVDELGDRLMQAVMPPVGPDALLHQDDRAIAVIHELPRFAGNSVDLDTRHRDNAHADVFPGASPRDAVTHAGADRRIATDVAADGATPERTHAGWFTSYAAAQQAETMATTARRATDQRGLATTRRLTSHAANPTFETANNTPLYTTPRNRVLWWVSYTDGTTAAMTTGEMNGAAKGPLGHQDFASRFPMIDTMPDSASGWFKSFDPGFGVRPSTSPGPWSGTRQDGVH